MRERGHCSEILHPEQPAAHQPASLQLRMYHRDRAAVSPRGSLLAAHSRFSIAIGAGHAVEVPEDPPILLRISFVRELAAQLLVIVRNPPIFMQAFESLCSWAINANHALRTKNMMSARTRIAPSMPPPMYM